MILAGKEIDHIEVYDETDRFVVCISDDGVIPPDNWEVKTCETDTMSFSGYNRGDIEDECEQGEDRDL